MRLETEDTQMTTPVMNNRHAAVLGGSAGIGLETARLLTSLGARVTVGGRDPGRLDDAVKQLGDRARGVTVDAGQAGSLRQFFAQAGPISDLVITVTRRGGAGPAAGLPEADLPGAFAGKTIAHLQAIALALPTLTPDGSITLVTAGSAQSALPGTVGLAAVNGALEAAVPPLAAELAPRRVNAVSPGVIETGWWDEVPEDARQETFKVFADRALVRRNGRPEDVAQAIVALIENGFITGVVLPCDGGLRLT
jgi:NAD(P)-dependent dehydrogenase (short-subunit alcohol dehydrogenase family)